MLALHKAGLYDGLFSGDTPEKKPPKSPKAKKVKPKLDSKAGPATVLAGRSFLAPKDGRPSLAHDPPPVNGPEPGSSVDLTRVNDTFLPEGGPKGVFCRALHDHQHTIHDGLSFKKGDVIRVLCQDKSGWWDGVLHGERGWVPSNFVALIDEDEDTLSTPPPDSPPTSPEPLVLTPNSSPQYEVSPGGIWHPSRARNSKAWHLPMRLGSEESFDSRRQRDATKDDPLEYNPRDSPRKASRYSSSSDGTYNMANGFMQSTSSFGNESKFTLADKSDSTITFGFPVVDNIISSGDSFVFEPVFQITDDQSIPWYLKPTDIDTPDILFGPEGSIRGGTLATLVERLTAHEQLADQVFVRSFFMTFNMFATAEEVVDSLIERFRIEAPVGLDPFEWEDWARSKQRIVQVRVLNIFRIMIQDRDILEQEDLHVVSKVLAFVQERDVAPLIAAKVLLNLIQRRNVGNDPQAIGNSSIPPASIVSNSSKRARFVNMSPLEVARQLTILENQLFRRIRPFECLRRVRDRRVDNFDNIAIIVQTSNKIADWVVEMVLKKQDSWKRAQILQHFISIADHCRNLKNFSTMAGIVSGLNTAPVRRMKETWSHVSERSLKELSVCEEILDSKKNFANYRQLVLTTTPPCVPFIGVMLSALHFIEDGNPDNFPDGLINFRKCHKFAGVLDEIKRWQAYPYNFKRVPFIMDFIEESLGRQGQARTEAADRFWQLSLEREPKGSNDNNDSPLHGRGEDLWFLALG